MIDVTDNYHKPLNVLFSELDVTSKEIATYCKSNKKASEKTVKAFRIKVNALIINIVSGFRFKNTRRGVELRFRICPPHRVPRPYTISDLHKKIQIASGLMHKLEKQNNCEFKAPSMEKYKTLNDIKKDIEFLLEADLETSDFMIIYQLRLNAERNAKIIAIIAIGAVLLGFGIVFYLKRTKNMDDDEDDDLDDDDEKEDQETMIDRMFEESSNELDERLEEED